YIGWLLHGTRGGIVAGTLFVLPGLAVIAALSALYATFIDTDWVTAVFFGLKAAVLAIVLQAVIKVGRRALASTLAVALAASAFVGIFVLDLPFPLIVLVAGLIGWGVARVDPGLLGIASGESAAAQEDAIADRLAAERGASGSGPTRAAILIVTWGSLWALPIVALALIFGTDSSYVALATFMSKMAVVTFGGAYAVLAYVAQQAVETYGWLAPDEMLDGLALAETTPGPLVLVLSFVGFLATFRDAVGLSPMVGGLLGTIVAAWVTFVPCFLWIFLGAPYIERLRNNRALSGALAAITAAVVGVILNLALWFGLHVAFRDVATLDWGPIQMPWPDLTSVDPLAVSLAGLAAAMLLILRLGVLTTLAASGILGLAIPFALGTLGLAP
ncbi:MAG: chromate transporter, partial [Pseudomonadota bacterium]